MRDTIDPTIEFDWAPMLWAAATVILLGVAGNLLLGRPQLLAHGAVLAGVVASFRSDYYQNSGYNAAVGTFFGILLITPALVYSRVSWGFGIDGTGDTLFLSIAFGLAWLIIMFMLLLPLAYIGAFFGDFTRKRIGGVLEY